MRIPKLALLIALAAAPAAAQSLPPGPHVPGPDEPIVIAKGPFEPTFESLAQYRCPEWFRDAKFGIWAHWGPQAVPMRATGTPAACTCRATGSTKDHLAHYGHPSKHGYKDIIPLWKAEKWDPDRLMALYKKAGASYFVSMGCAPRQLLPVELEAPPVERREHGAAARRGGRLAEGGAEVRPALRRLRAPGRQLHLVPGQPRRRQDRPAGRRALRRGRPEATQDLYHFPAAPGDTGWYSTDPRVAAGVVRPRSRNWWTTTTPTCSTPTAACRSATRWARA